MKEIFINVDFYNSEGIKTIQGNNNAETYKICILKSKVRLSLVGKTVKLGYVMAGTTKGDIIEDLNISNAEQGEITFPITNKISKKDGIYTCQLAIYGADEFLEYTATFGLTVQANIFTKIAGEIADTKDLTYIERILEEAKTVGRDLKTNIPVATNLNSSLENNISNAGNINTTLADTAEKSKVAANDAMEKKSQLENSITKAKEFIGGLDGSQDIPGIRMELTELQNGLKSNQALAYSGSSVSANDTLEGRTESMKICGMTLFNCILTPIINRTYTANSTQQMYNYKVLRKANATYTIIVFISKNTLNNNFSLLSWGRTSNGNPIAISTGEKGLIKKSFSTNDNTEDWFLELWKENTTGEIKIDYMMVLEGDWTNKDVPSYFEGLKSFGEAEQEGDKYKVSILSCGKNLFNCNLLTPSSDQITNFKIGGSIISGNFNGQYNSTKSVKFVVTTKVKVLIKAYLKGCRLIINNCWLENGEFRSIIDTNNWSNNETQELLSSRIVYIDKNSSLRVENPHQSAHSFSVRDLICYKVDGTENESYLPYRQDKKDILIKESLRGFAENTCDVMYEDNGQVKVNREVGKYTFTGDEGWTLGIQSNGWSEFDDTLVFYLDPFKAKTNTRFICDKFAYKNVVNIDEVGIYNNVWGNKPHPVIRIKKSELSTPDLEGFKSWLKTNPTTMIYQLAEPTIEIVENCVDIDLDTYQEKTYFNILNSLPGTLDFKVPSNIGSVVQNMAKEVNNIWDVINNLLVPSIVKANGNLAMLKLNNNLN